jgi:hypothetical protein
MVYNPDIGQPKQRLTAILVAHLTSAQLDTVQEQFAIGAHLCSPNPVHELFIQDRREWSSFSHADLKRACLSAEPLIVVDARTPKDGSIWYIERFADDEDVENGEAENTSTLYKIRMNIPDVIISYTNYDIANTSIREDMDRVDIPYPTPEQFDQEEVFKSGFDYIKDRYLGPTWVIAAPDEIESSTDPDDLENFAPKPDIVWRLKEEVAKQNGLESRWTFGNETRDVNLPNGTKKTFPEGSMSLQCDYDPETSIPTYERPEGSL